MNIPVEKVLTKIMAEAQVASQVTSDKEQREHIVIIKSLCELILEEAPSEQPVVTPVQTEQFVQMQSSSNDEQGGNSLLDF